MSARLAQRVEGSPADARGLDAAGRGMVPRLTVDPAMNVTFVVHITAGQAVVASQGVDGFPLSLRAVHRLLATGLASGPMNSMASRQCLQRQSDGGVERGIAAHLATALSEARTVSPATGSVPDGRRSRSRLLPEIVDCNGVTVSLTLCKSRTKRRPFPRHAFQAVSHRRRR